MPRKLRTPKQRRVDVERELAAWSMMFECGDDERSARHAARAVWQRLGELFLLRRDAAREYHKIPWAQQKFGEPPCR